MEKLPADAPTPRLCHLFKWPDFDGYGFNLHGEKSKPGQYIGKVDPDSPAELAGLKAKDRIVEVNGTNISNENHKQVVQRIKAIPNETKLLVLDDSGEEYYKSRNIIVTGDMPNVIYMRTPVPRPTNNDNDTDDHHIVIEKTAGMTVNSENDNTTDESNRDAQKSPENQTHQRDEEDSHSHISDSGSAGSSSLPSKSSSIKKEPRDEYNNDDDISPGPSPSPPGSTASPSPTPLNMMSNNSSKGSNSSLDLNMTAQEMRAKLAARKKFDPKSQKMDFRKKYDIIQTL